MTGRKAAGGLLAIAVLGAADGGVQGPARTAPYSEPRFQPVLDRMKLQLGPKPYREVPPAELKTFSSPEFHLAGQHLRFACAKVDPKDGDRVELRQLDTWRVGETSNGMHAIMTLIGAEMDEVTVLQIHDAGAQPNKPLLRIAWRRARGQVLEHLWAVVRTRLDADVYDHLDLGPLALGARFEARIAVAGGKLTVSANGVELPARDVAYWTEPVYFKAGCYPQGVGTSQVAFESLEVGHGDGARP